MANIFEITKDLKENAEVLGVIVTALVTVTGILWKTVITNRDKARRLSEINRAFQDVTKALTASSNEKERLAAAILLRRFFDTNGEYALKVFNKREVPYARAALDLTAALLKIEQEGPVQKALADSLVLSDNLHLADLQSTNLANAYLGRRQVEPNTHGVILRGLDLYMANLSGASLRNADCENAVFSGGLLQHAIFDDAILVGANFSGATLDNARFKRAKLRNAKFTKCKMENVNFEGADISGAYFSNVDLRTTTFTNAVGVPTFGEDVKNRPASLSTKSFQQHEPAL